MTLSVLTLCFLACTSGDSKDSGFSVNVDSSGKYPVVLSKGEPPVWSAEKLFVLGSVEGGDDEFGSVRSVILDGKGSVRVLDPSYKRIAVFDSLGAFSADLGREGAGPGEYRSPYSMA